MGKYGTTTRRTDKGTGMKTTTSSKKSSPGKTSTTRSYESAGFRYSYNLNTGKRRKTKLW